MLSRAQSNNRSVFEQTKGKLGSLQGQAETRIAHRPEIKGQKVPPRVLVIEAPDLTGPQLERELKYEFDLFTASDHTKALMLAREHSPSVILLDLDLSSSRLKSEESFQFLREIREYGFHGKVIVCSSNGERENAARAISLGAYDVLTKPLDFDLLKLLIRRASWIAELEQEWRPRLPKTDDGFKEMVGTSDSIRKVFSVIRKVVTTDVSVLIAGESGTGKELTARTIHERSLYKRGPFVPINCGAIPENLLESELFGYEKGAFTGAIQQKKGKVEYADGGTLFLDEIGELPLALQVKLLRFLQEKTIERVGGWQQVKVNTRIIVATNTDLMKAISEGRFREDLYYRIGVVGIYLPPLRERGEDLLLIAHVVLKQLVEQVRKPVRGFTREAVHAIQAYPWPGNVRELSNKIRRAVVMAEGPSLTPEDLDLFSPTEQETPPSMCLRAARCRLEADLITHVLTVHQGDFSRVAKELKISRPTLYGLLRKHGIQGKALRIKSIIQGH